MTADPNRELQRVAFCRCVIGRRDVMTGHWRYDVCGAAVSGPDEPMCEHCMHHGHHTLPDQLPLTDTRRPQLERGWR